MARRKQRLSLKPDLFRAVGLVFIIVLGIAFVVLGAAAFLRGVCASSLFTVRDITIAENIKPLDLPELAKLKGQNLFSVDLLKVEARIRARYPHLADLCVLRQFPDQILVTATKRDPFARISMDGHVVVIDRHGYMIGPSVEGPEPLTVIKGLKRQKVAYGDRVGDARIKLAVTIITLFHQEKRLAAVGLETLHMDDLTRIVCDLGAEEAGFQVYIDKDNVAARFSTLSDVLSRGGLDLKQIKYMDLRFGEPILGQKKVKK